MKYSDIASALTYIPVIGVEPFMSFCSVADLKGIQEFSIADFSLVLDAENPAKSLEFLIIQITHKRVHHTTEVLLGHQTIVVIVKLIECSSQVL